MALKITKGQICDGSISKNMCDEEHNLCGKFHNCFTKCTKYLYFLFYTALLMPQGDNDKHKMSMLLSAINKGTLESSPSEVAATLYHQLSLVNNWLVNSRMHPNLVLRGLTLLDRRFILFYLTYRSITLLYNKPTNRSILD